MRDLWYWACIRKLKVNDRKWVVHGARAVYAIACMLGAAQITTCADCVVVRLCVIGAIQVYELKNGDGQLTVEVSM